eukprot:TRINITY_DN1404_c0_g1_i2.p1 TRINITY_DN1404_c0_g1~~TRINITY_DN1404_c0_g1_i2.p1  ORF type:complete len:1049 (-),score=196.85 TRINITY_DN1404_c0_g1_i2:241-3345(-)
MVKTKEVTIRLSEGPTTGGGGDGGGDGASVAERFVTWCGVVWRGALAAGRLWRQLLNQTLKQIAMHKANYFLGFMSVFIVVITISVTLSIVQNAPVIFLQLAEQSNGQIDLNFTLSSSNEHSINYTTISSILQENKFSYHAPRMTLESSATYSAKECEANVSISDPIWKYHGLNNNITSCGIGCFSSICGNPTPDTNTVLAIDTEKEDRMQLGRKWRRHPLQKGFCYITSKAAGRLGVGAGDTIVVAAYLPLNPTLSELLESKNATLGGKYIFLPFIIQEVVSGLEGKSGDSSDYTIVVEYSKLLPHIIEHLDPWAVDGKAKLQPLSLYEFAQSVALNLPPSRTQMYVQSDVDKMQKDVTSFLAEAIYRIGFQSISTTLPVITNMQPYKFVLMFIGLIVNITIIVLTTLSILLIYSLLMVNVETRTFEVGVMRVLGATRQGIVAMLFTQAFLYAIPSWATGLILGQIISAIVANLFENMTTIPTNRLLSTQAILVSTLLAFLIPAVASILPIRAALQKHLHEALDTSHSKADAVKVSVRRSEDDTTQTKALLIVGVVLSIFGFGVYYIFPQSLLALNITLMLNLFFLLIIGMLFGLVLMSLSIEHFMERLCTYIFFFDRTAIRTIVRKNLTAHKLRNRKTSIMYSVSLSFVIFIYVAYQIQTVSMVDDLKKKVGTPLRIEANGEFSNGTVHSIKAIKELESITHPMILGHAWLTRNLGQGPQTTSVGSSEYSHLLRTISDIQGDYTYVHAISPNFFDVVYPEYLRMGEEYPDGGVDPKKNSWGWRHYSKFGSGSLVLAQSLKSTYGIELGEHLKITTEKLSFSSSSDSNSNTGTLVSLLPTNKSVSTHRFSVNSFVKSTPVFDHSEFTTTNPDTTLSFPTFLNVAGSLYDSVENLDLRYFFLKISKKATDKDLDQIKNLLTAAVQAQKNSGYIPEVYDLRDESNFLSQAESIINYFFVFTTFVAMLTSFFSLTSSMVANVHEQTKELAVLRAVGMEKRWMYRLYIYEAFCVVFTSSLFGILIGTMIGFYSLFTN